MLSSTDVPAFLALQLKLAETERNIYQPAELIDQNRYAPGEYLHELISPYGKQGLELVNGNIQCRETKRQIQTADNVINLKYTTTEGDKEWARLNTQFLNYHKSLTVYTLINSMPTLNYFAQYSGLADLKDVKVVDVGAGTGHCMASLFNYPETIDYFLLDPNLRKLHDQFIRIYPKLAKLKLKHILSHAEFLPLQDGLADVVTSISAIDHYSDYKKFIEEAHRILKPGGLIIIWSHLDKPKTTRQQYIPWHKKIFSDTFIERMARYRYYKKHAVGEDDHTLHLHDTTEMAEALRKSGFEVVMDHTYLDYFILKARKIT